MASGSLQDPRLAPGLAKSAPSSTPQHPNSGSPSPAAQLAALPIIPTANKQASGQTAARGPVAAFFRVKGARRPAALPPPRQARACPTARRSTAPARRPRAAAAARRRSRRPASAPGRPAPSASAAGGRWPPAAQGPPADSETHGPRAGVNPSYAAPGGLRVSLAPVRCTGEPRRPGQTRNSLRAGPVPAAFAQSRSGAGRVGPALSEQVPS